MSRHHWNGTVFRTLGGTIGMETPSTSGLAAIPEFTSASVASSKRVSKMTCAATAIPTLNFNWLIMVNFTFQKQQLQLFCCFFKCIFIFRCYHKEEIVTDNTVEFWRDSSGQLDWHAHTRKT